MPSSTLSRKIATATLALALVLWVGAGLALVPGDQVMQCSMSMQQMQLMGQMSYCPSHEARIPAPRAERPPCCSVSQTQERPLGFVVSSERASHSLDVLAALPAEFTPTATEPFRIWRSSDAPRFIKPVLELKTDLRI